MSLQSISQLTSILVVSISPLIHNILVSMIKFFLSLVWKLVVRLKSVSPLFLLRYLVHLISIQPVSRLLLYFSKEAQVAG